jgi:signal transduction histidine kinase
VLGVCLPFAQGNTQAENQHVRSCQKHFVTLLWLLLLGAGSNEARGTVLWSHPDEVLVCNNGAGEDILRGAIKPQTANSAGTLYFRVLVNPISDTAGKVVGEFEAGFMLVANGVEHLGIGNARGAMAYSAVNVPKAPKGFQDLNSRVPQPPFAYEYMRGGIPRYIVMRVEYIPGRDARVTAWLDPDLSIGATEFNQPTNIVVQFEANANFDEIRLVHRGYGGGWRFSQMLVASSFEDLLIPRFWQRKWFLAVVVVALVLAVAGAVRYFERRRAKQKIHLLERERAVISERARIARDIHDEVGAELAQIGLLSDIGAEVRPEQAGERFLQIGKRARHLVGVMDEIVWAVNPQNDNLRQLADYLCQMADDCFSEGTVRLRRDVPGQLPEFPIRAEVRHDLTLAVKEALANVLKHSGASEATLRLDWNQPDLMIAVEDNGRGFDASGPGPGNGLGNQQIRLKRIGGRVELTSTPGQGTKVVFAIKLEET